MVIKYRPWDSEKSMADKFSSPLTGTLFISIIAPKFPEIDISDNAIPIPPEEQSCTAVMFPFVSSLIRSRTDFPALYSSSINTSELFPEQVRR